MFLMWVVDREEEVRGMFSRFFRGRRELILNILKVFLFLKWFRNKILREKCYI